MITPELKEAIITEIGPDYGLRILSFAKKTGFKKERGGGHYKNPNIFWDVMSGRYENKRLEKFILKVYKHYKQENEKHAQEVEAILAAQ